MSNPNLVANISINNYDKSKSIAFYSHKGGVGKSTLIFETAYSLAMKHNRHVVIIDADSQLNTTFKLLNRMDMNIDNEFIDRLLCQGGTEPLPFPQKHVKMQLANSILAPDRQVGTLYSYMCGAFAHEANEFTNNLLTLPDTENRVHFLIGSPILHNLEFQLVNAICMPNSNPGIRHVPLLFFQLIQKIKEYYANKEQSVIILVDMSPSSSKINQNILLSCDSFILPLDTNDGSMVSLRLLFHYLHTWRQEHGYLPPSHYTKFLFAILNRYKVSFFDHTQMSPMVVKIQHRVMEMITLFLMNNQNANFKMQNHDYSKQLLKFQDMMQIASIMSDQNKSLFEILNCSELNNQVWKPKTESAAQELSLISEAILKSFVV
jgi:cellulose biosynthesis protein BcsQ